MIKITEHPRKVRCEINRCSDMSTNPVWIYEEGAPMQTRFICCEHHLREIIPEGQKYFLEKYGEMVGMTVETGKPEQITGEIPQENGDLQQRCMEIEAENAVLNSTINELRSQLAEQKQKQTENKGFQKPSKRGR